MARKSFVSRMEKASGVEEEYDERAQKIDIILDEMKQKKEEAKQK